MCKRCCDEVSPLHLRFSCRGQTHVVWKNRYVVVDVGGKEYMKWLNRKENCEFLPLGSSRFAMLLLVYSHFNRTNDLFGSCDARRFGSALIKYKELNYQNFNSFFEDCGCLQEEVDICLFLQLNCLRSRWGTLMMQLSRGFCLQTILTQCMLRVCVCSLDTVACDGKNGIKLTK